MTNGRVCRLTAQGWAQKTEVPDAPVLKVPIGKILTALDESGANGPRPFKHELDLAGYLNVISGSVCKYVEIMIWKFLFYLVYVCF